MKLNKWIHLIATEGDNALLERIARQDGHASKSATVRRLIREEAQRRGLETPAEQPDTALETA